MGTGKTYRHESYKTIALVGKRDSGVLTECLKNIKTYISVSKKAKQDWRVLVITDTPDDFSSFKPIVEPKDVAGIKNKVIVIHSKNLKPIYPRFHDGLLVIDSDIIYKDNPNSEEENIATFLLPNRTFKTNTLLCLRSFKDFRVRVIQNTDFIKLFLMDAKDMFNSDYNNKMFSNGELLNLAEHCFLYEIDCHKGMERTHILIDLENEKIKCTEKAFCDAILIFTKILHTKHLKALTTNIALLSRFLKYYQN